MATIPEYKNLIEETAKVFNQPIEDNVVNGLLRHKLKNDVFLFSGLRTHAQLYEASRLLLDANGKIKSYEEFEKDFLKINKKYNQNYLKAEYDYATGTSIDADRWSKFSNDTDRYWLQKRTAKDEKVRVSHKKLHGITLPKNHPFWNHYAGKLGWGCRCFEIEVLASKYSISDGEKAIELGKKATTQIGKGGKNKLEIFRMNPGKDRVIFPKNHPYYPKHCQGEKLNLTGLIGLGDFVLSAEKDRCVALKVIKNEADKWHPLYEERYLKEYKNGGKIITSNLINVDDSDYEAVLKCCEHFAKDGKVATILPSFNSPLKSDLYKTLYKELEGTKFWGKCPDFKIGNAFYEHEGFETTNKAAEKMLKRGLKQSTKIVIEKADYSNSHLSKLIKFRLYEGKLIDEVWILDNGKLNKFYP